MRYPKRWKMPREMIEFNLSGSDPYTGIDACLHYLGWRWRQRLRAMWMVNPF